ncbi:MAG: GHKL domain-containing protein [Proteobacteria bacterium]|nr:GHKL domain-containing protein [Pseudomonadota bacterium]
MATVLLGISFPIINAMLVYPMFQDILVQGVEEDVEGLVRHLMPELLSFQEVEGITTLGIQELVAIDSMVSNFDIMKLKVFNENGVTIYSTDAGDFGVQNEHPYFREHIARGEVYSLVVSKDSTSMEGTPVPVDVVETYVPMMRDGHFAGALEIYYDITARKRSMDVLIRNSLVGMAFMSLALVAAVAALLKKQSDHVKLLEQTQTLKEDVERIVQHDLKSPVANMLSGINFLHTTNQDAEQLDILEQMQTAGWRMMRMINNSLDLYKMETGRYTYQPSAVNIAQVVRNAANELGDLALSRGTMFCLFIEGAEASKDESFMVYGEEMLCHSLVVNLLKNAIEATPRMGCVEVNFFREPEWFCLEISNPGTIPKEILAEFFNKYVTWDKRGGTGLGTYSAKLITETQGGTISVECEEDIVRVLVRLPVISTFEIR